jgi:5-methylcytosine-specific restriction endonuclease McrA
MNRKLTPLQIEKNRERSRRHYYANKEIYKERAKRQYEADKEKHHEQVKPGMTWENYGTTWHIDHKIPIAAFNFERPDDIDFRLCWSLKNLQPLEVTKNLSKGGRVENPFQPSLAISARQ